MAKTGFYEVESTMNTGRVYVLARFIRQFDAEMFAVEFVETAHVNACVMRNNQCVQAFVYTR